MAKAPENDAALARYIEKLDRDNSVPAELKHLDAVLCTIATDRNLPDPKLQAKVIRYKLVKRIDYCRSSQARFLHYGHFIDGNSDSDPRLAISLGLQVINKKLASVVVPNLRLLARQPWKKPQPSKIKVSLQLLSGARLIFSKALALGRAKI
jgi:hypothetical protein